LRRGAGRAGFPLSTDPCSPIQASPQVLMEWRRGRSLEWGSIHSSGRASGPQSLRSMRRSTARSSSSEYCSSRACVCSAPTAPGLPAGLDITAPARPSSSCRTEEKVFLRSWLMRLCSAEGVLQLATCNGNPEVSRRNSGGDYQNRCIKGRGPPMGLATPEGGTVCPARCGWECHKNDHRLGDRGLPDYGTVYILLATPLSKLGPCWTAPSV
uniref:Uncharacterized protein n=1 Tax=Catagonus wagneri TaxID=51154 RepID=A0A8C3VMZ1_9CETA